MTTSIAGRSTECDEVLQALEEQREMFLITLRGLSDAQISARTTVSDLTLGGLLKQLQQSGQSDVAHSWVGPGENKSISEGDLANALGGDTLDTLAHETGLGRDDLLSGLSRNLPHFVDQLTPDGRLPTEQEADRMV